MAYINQKPLDENGLAHGIWLTYYDNGKLRFRWNYFHGINHGLQERYFQNGTLYYRGIKNMGKRNGFWYYHYQQNEYFLWLI